MTANSQKASPVKKYTSLRKLRLIHDSMVTADNLADDIAFMKRRPDKTLRCGHKDNERIAAFKALGDKVTITPENDGRMMAIRWNGHD